MKIARGISSAVIAVLVLSSLTLVPQPSPAEQQLPDLVVDVCESGSQICYTIKNIGSVSLPVGWSALAKVYFDGKERGFFNLGSPTSTTGGGIDKPGGSSYYLLPWDITGPVTVAVIADDTNSDWCAQKGCT
jgi:hypothetical protein